MQRYFASVSPIFLDGCIAVCIAMLTAISMNVAQDDASKYISAEFRWWLIVILGTLTQGLHALSKFRDQTFSRHMDRLDVAAGKQEVIDNEDRADRRAQAKQDNK